MDIPDIPWWHLRGKHKDWGRGEIVKRRGAQVYALILPSSHGFVSLS